MISTTEAVSANEIRTVLPQESAEDKASRGPESRADGGGAGGRHGGLVAQQGGGGWQRAVQPALGTSVPRRHMAPLWKSMLSKSSPLYRDSLYSFSLWEWKAQERELALLKKHSDRERRTALTQLDK